MKESAVGCANCEYAPTTYEEYCMGNECPDAFKDHAKNCNNYNNVGGKNGKEEKTNTDINRFVERRY